MAIGASGFHATAVGVMNGAGVLGKDILFHFMTTDAELFRVGDFHPPVEATPEYDADDHEHDGTAECGPEQDLAREQTLNQGRVTHRFLRFVGEG